MYWPLDCWISCWKESKDTAFMFTYILCGYCPHRRRLQRTTSPGAVVNVCVKYLKFGNNTAMRSGCHSFHKVKIMSLGSQQKCFLFSFTPPSPPSCLCPSRDYLCQLSLSSSSQIGSFRSKITFLPGSNPDRFWSFSSMSNLHFANRIYLELVV